jgi:hypothetical protein
MRFASFVLTTARPVSPTMATGVGTRSPAPVTAPMPQTRSDSERLEPPLSVEEFVQLARSAGAL